MPASFKLPDNPNDTEWDNKFEAWAATLPPTKGLVKMLKKRELIRALEGRRIPLGNIWILIEGSAYRNFPLWTYTRLRQFTAEELQTLLDNSRTLSDITSLAT